MDPNISNYVLQTVQRYTQLELASLQLTELRKIANTLSVSTTGKRKDVLVEELSRTLGAAILKSKSSFTHMIGGFPQMNSNAEIGSKHPIFKKIMDKCNEFAAHSSTLAAPQQSQLMMRPMMNFYGYVDPMQLLNTSVLNRFPQTNFMQNQVQTQQQQPPPVQQKKKLTNLNCVCGLPVYEESKDPIVKCTNADCNRVLHANCLKMKPASEEAKIYECPDCTLKRCDPLHDVLDILRMPFRVDQNKQEFMIDQSCHKRIEGDANIGIEIRCIRIEEKNQEQTWPYQGELFLNSKRELEFKPLQQNSSLKKRKDEKFFARNVYCGLNNVLIKYVPKADFIKKQEGETYYAAVYLVRKLSCEELIGRIKRNNVRKIEDCKALVKEHFREGDIEIDRLSYQLTCVLDMQLLKTPVKGIHCKHVNCFSLENFVNVWYKNNQRKWVCPICKTKAYDIVIDSYYQEILKAAQESGVLESELPEVTIDKNANFFFSVTNGKDVKSKKSKDDKMIPEQTSELPAKAEEESKTLTNGVNDVVNQPKKARDEPNKNASAFTIVLDSEEEDDSLPKASTIQQKEINPSQQSDLQNSAPIISQVPVNGFEENKIETVQQSSSGANARDVPEEVKMHIESEMPKESSIIPSIRPELLPMSLVQNPDPNLASLKNDISLLAGSTNLISNLQLLETNNLIPGEMVPENRSQTQIGQFGSTTLAQVTEKNQTQLGIQNKEVMEIEISDDSDSDNKDNAGNKQTVLQQSGGLNNNYYQGYVNYMNPHLFNSGFGLGINDNMLTDLQKNLLMNNGLNPFQTQQLQQQQQLQLQQQLLQQQQIQQQQQLQQQIQLQQHLAQQQQLKAQQQLQQQALAQLQVQQQQQQQAQLQVQQQQQVQQLQQQMQIELGGLQKERRELCFTIDLPPEDPSSFISSTKESITNIIKRAEKDEDLLTFEAFSGNKQKKPKKCVPFAITTKKKFLRSFYKYLDDELKQILGGKGGEVTSKRKSGTRTKEPGEKESKRSKTQSDKMQIEGEINNLGISEENKRGNTESSNVPKQRKPRAAKKTDNGGVGNLSTIETPAIISQAIPQELLSLNNTGSINNREINQSKGQASDPICLD